MSVLIVDRSHEPRGDRESVGLNWSGVECINKKARCMGSQRALGSGIVWLGHGSVPGGSMFGTDEGSKDSPPAWVAKSPAGRGWTGRMGRQAIRMDNRLTETAVPNTFSQRESPSGRRAKVWS
jgi:hypothetical protein